METTKLHGPSVNGFTLLKPHILVLLQSRPNKRWEVSKQIIFGQSFKKLCQLKVKKQSCLRA